MERVGGERTNGGAAGGKTLGTSMAWDGRLSDDRGPATEREVTGKIISNNRLVNKGRPRLVGVGVFEIFENLMSSQNSTCQEIRRHLEIRS